MYSRTRFEGLLNKDFISGFFFQRQCVVRHRQFVLSFRFLFFFFKLSLCIERSSVKLCSISMSTRKHKGEIYYSIVHAFQLDEFRNLNGLPVVLHSTLGACRERMKPVGPSRLSALFILKTLSSQILSITILARYNVVKQITCL